MLRTNPPVRSEQAPERGHHAPLVPVYSHEWLRDLMVGQPLRYRLNADGSFVL